MLMKASGAALMALLWLAAGAAPAFASGPPAGLVEQLEKAVDQDGAPGVAAIVLRDGQPLYEVSVGDIDPDAPLPVASASKWVAAALVLTLVDEGLLALDQPVGALLPEIAGEAGPITLRQLLSFTSGHGSIRSMADLLQPPDITLAESARRIAARPLEDEPGTVFKYGSGALQIAGALAERVAGKSWATLFEERLARPLRMKESRWIHPFDPADGQRTSNPNLQAGLVTTARDYARFLTMLSGNGMFEGRRILSGDAVKALRTPTTVGLDMSYVPPGAAGTQLHYALGNWCERIDRASLCAMSSSPGALGTYPWIDWENGVYGIFIAQYRLPPIAARLREARRIGVDDAARR